MTPYEIIAIALGVLCLVMTIVLAAKVTRLGTKDSSAELLAQLRKENEELKQSLIKQLGDSTESLRRAMLEDNRGTRSELATNNQNLIKQINDGISQSDKAQRDSLYRLQESTENRLDAIRKGVTDSIDKMNSANRESLQAMQETVDEKLSSTINKRFNESFNAISERLDAVNKGLGEMNALAAGVGDLKRVLTNVKTRGTWGEMQLGALLEQILSPHQYRANVKIRPRSNDVVEFAIVLPGKDDNKDIFLPIDSKFPIESYQRLMDARENGDVAAQEAQTKSLIADVKHNARTIKDKYIAPPYSTDFAIMYLPTEGLYSFVAADVELLELLQREYRITVMGPTTLGAFLNSLQMGFRTLEIQKKTSAVWKAVEGIKKDFGKFGELLERTQKKLDGARDDIYEAVDKTRRIQEKLNKLELPSDADARGLLGEATEQ